MLKTVLIAFISAVIVVNLIGWLLSSYTELDVTMAVRIPIILGITFIAAIFSGAGSLVTKASRDKPE